MSSTAETFDCIAALQDDRSCAQQRATMPLTHWIVILVATTLGLCVVVMGLRGLRFPAKDALQPLVVCGGLGIAALYYRSRGVTNFVLCLRSLITLVAFSIPFCLLTYALATNAYPWADPALTAIDAFFGLSAASVVNWVAQYHWLSIAFYLIYFSLISQTILMIVVLGFSNQERRLDLFFVRFMLAALVTVALFAFFPAEGTCSGYHLPVPKHYANILDHLSKLRSGVWHQITWCGAEGIVTFPSFHTIWAVLLAAAFFRHPLFVPIAVLNALVVVSTIPVGMHYCADVMAGLAIAAGVIWLTKRMV